MNNTNTSGPASQIFLAALTEFQSQFDEWLSDYLNKRREESSEINPDLAGLFDTIRQFSVSSGKRLRPFLVYWGARGCGNTNDTDVMPVAAAAEMLHVFALIHDDLMDQSDLRRGLPTVHKVFESYHTEQGLRGKPELFGLSAAILAGDLAMALSDTLIDSAPLSLEIRANVRRIWNLMQEEVIQGQYLDILASNAVHPASEELIWSILSLKSGKYTMERPMHLGAACAGAEGDVLEVLSRVAIPLGRTFQIQDDILGVFGSPEETGKPADSDIREGKSTLMIAKAYAVADSDDKVLLTRVWGNADATDSEISQIRDILLSTGAVGYARQRAKDSAGDARKVLQTAPLTEEAKQVLSGLADFVLNRKA